MLSLTSIAISLLGSHYYISEIIGLFLVLYRLQSSITVSYLSIGIFAAAISILAQINNIELLHLYIYFMFLAVMGIKKATISSLDEKYFTAILVLNCVISILIGIDTIIGAGTPNLVSQYLCLYGERSTGCHVHSYIINGVPFIRLYGLSSEPQTFALYLLFSMTLALMYNIHLKHPVKILILLCFILTFSITMYAAAIFTVLFTDIFLKKLRQRIYAAISLTLLSGSAFFLLTQLKDTSLLAFVLYKRTFGRLLELFSGEDRSATLRTKGTFKPLTEYLHSFENYPLGTSLAHALDFIQTVSFYTRIDGIINTVEGQPASSLIYYIIAFGTLSIFAFFLLSLKLNRPSKMLILVLFTYLNPYGLSAAIFLFFMSLNLRKVDYA